LNHQEITVLLLSLAVLIGVARILGEIARNFHQPAVLGEMLAGILLGPTVFGSLWPAGQLWLFPAEGPAAVALSGISTLAIVLFLLVAGMEVDLSLVWSQGLTALKVGTLGTIIPFVLGLAGAWFLPTALGREPAADPLIFALFLATAMAISALPVIAKTLLDLNLYRTDFGMIVVSAAIFNDLIGWTVFAVILGMIDGQAHQASSGFGTGIAFTVTLTLLYAGLMLTLGRWLIHRILPRLQAYTHWPGGVLGFAVTLALVGATFTEYIGIHAIFGSFIVGIALGDSRHLQERTRTLLDEFVSFIFAPLFFAGIGLRVNFATHFDLKLTLLVLLLACVGKVLGVYAGAAWGKLPVRDRWAIGFAMNARGAMEIILGLLALEAGVIEQPLFVALVIMAIVTSAASGPLIQRTMRRRQQRQLLTYLSPKLYVHDIQAESRREAMAELVTLACQHHDLDQVAIERRVWAREELVATGIGGGVAIPHARIAGLKEPIVVVGMSDAGIDFDAPDGQASHVVFLLLTANEEPAAQIELSADIGRMFREPHAVERLMRAENFTEFLAVMKMLQSHHK